MTCNRIKPWGLATAMLLAVLGADTADASDQHAPNLGELAKPATFHATDLSPDGRVVIGHYRRKEANSLVLRNLVNGEMVVLDANGMDLRYEARWINNERLLVWVYRPLARGGEALMGMAAVHRSLEPRQHPYGIMHKVAADKPGSRGHRNIFGARRRNLSSDSKIDSRPPRKSRLRLLFRGEEVAGVRLLSLLPDEEETVLLSVRRRGKMRREVLRYNLLHGTRARVAKDVPDAYRWVVDGSGRVRAALVPGESAETHEIYFRAADEDGEWRVLADVPAEGTIPLALDAGGKYLLVAARRDSERYGIYRLSTESGRFSGPLLADENYDVVEVVTDRWNAEPLFVHYVAEQNRRVFVDDDARALHTAINHVLKGTTNTVVASSRSGDRHLVAAQSSHSPTAYYYLNMADNRMRMIASSRPGLHGADFSRSKTVKLSERGGVQRYAQLTTGREGQPLVIRLAAPGRSVARGGPRFDPVVQALSAEGFSVLDLVSARARVPDLSGGVDADERARAVETILREAVDWVAENSPEHTDNVCFLVQGKEGMVALSAALKTSLGRRCLVATYGVLEPAVADLAPPAHIGEPPHARIRFRAGRVATATLESVIDIKQADKAGPDDKPRMLVVHDTERRALMDLVDEVEEGYRGVESVRVGEELEAYRRVISFMRDSGDRRRQLADRTESGDNSTH